jgi:hypothetical protein
MYSTIGILLVYQIFIVTTSPHTKRKEPPAFRTVNNDENCCRSHTLLLLMYFQTPLILICFIEIQKGAESNNYNVAAYRIPTDVFHQLGFFEIPTYFIVATSHTLLLLLLIYFQNLRFLCFIEIQNGMRVFFVVKNDREPVKC